jgi:LacI family transcriptional regulator
LKNYNKKRPTVQEIADEISISASTVSRALNNHPKISQATKEKVWEAAKKLGYQPNIPAYMNSDKTKTICFMVPDLSTSFYRAALFYSEVLFLKYLVKKRYEQLDKLQNETNFQMQFWLQHTNC